MDSTYSTVSKTRQPNMPFYFLLFFMFINFIAPQEYFPALKALRPALLAGIIASLTHFFYCAKTHKAFIVWGKETQALMLFALFAALSIPLSMWPGGSLAFFVNIFIKVIILFLLIAHVINTLPKLKIALNFILCFCVFLSFVGIKNYLSGTSTRIQGAASGMATNPNDLALSIVLTIPVAYAFAAISKTLFKKFIYWAYFLLASVGVFVTFSRGGFVIMIIICSLIFLKSTRNNLLKALCILIVAAAFISAFTPQNYMERLSTIFDISSDETGSAQERRKVILASMEIVSESPFQGAGLNCSQLALNMKMPGLWRETHNIYLQIAVELGIPALLIFLALIFMLLGITRDIQITFKNSSDPGDRDLATLAQALQFSIIGFCAGTIFWPVAYNNYFYYYAGFIVALKHISMDRFKERLASNRTTTQLVTGETS